MTIFDGTAVFDSAFEFLMENEGGYTVDHAGQTKFGITKKSYPNEDIPNLTKSRAKTIYRRDFWTPYPWKNIENRELAIKVFDFAVNAGPSRATQKLLSLIMTLGGTYLHPHPVRLNTEALRRLNEALREDPEGIIKKWIDIISVYYSHLAEKPRFKKFKKGWLRRAQRRVRL